MVLAPVHASGDAGDGSEGMLIGGERTQADGGVGDLDAHGGTDGRHMAGPPADCVHGDRELGDRGPDADADQALVAALPQAVAVVARHEGAGAEGARVGQPGKAGGARC